MGKWNSETRVELQRALAPAQEGSEKPGAVSPDMANTPAMGSIFRKSSLQGVWRNVQKRLGFAGGGAAREEEHSSNSGGSDGASAEPGSAGGASEDTENV